VSFQEALKKNTNYALAYVNLGKALIDLEKFDEALKSFERALKIDPSNRDAQEAINLYKEGKIGE
jgi:tetratricopeptide (TPR) repeat protein